MINFLRFRISYLLLYQKIVTILVAQFLVIYDYFFIIYVAKKYNLHEKQNLSKILLHKKKRVIRIVKEQNHKYRRIFERMCFEKKKILTHVSRRFERGFLALYVVWNGGKTCGPRRE